MKTNDAIYLLDEIAQELRRDLPSTSRRRAELADRLGRHREHLKSIAMVDKRPKRVDRRELGDVIAADVRRGR